MYETEKTRVQASRKSRSESREEQRRVSDPYGGTPLHLPEGLTQRIRESFGIEAERLKLRESPEVAQMGARATAQGDAIRFAPGEFRPDSAEGLSVLGHELEHVREQARGETTAPGGKVLRDSASESRSDSAGAAFAGGALRAGAPVRVTPGASAAPVQMDEVKKKEKIESSFSNEDDDDSSEDSSDSLPEGKEKIESSFSSEDDDDSSEDSSGSLPEGKEKIESSFSSEDDDDSSEDSSDSLPEGKEKIESSFSSEDDDDSSEDSSDSLPEGKEKIESSFSTGRGGSRDTSSEDDSLSEESSELTESEGTLLNRLDEVSDPDRDPAYQKLVDRKKNEKLQNISIKNPTRLRKYRDKHRIDTDSKFNWKALKKREKMQGIADAFFNLDWVTRKLGDKLIKNGIYDPMDEFTLFKINMKKPDASYGTLERQYPEFLQHYQRYFEKKVHQAPIGNISDKEKEERRFARERDAMDFFSNPSDEFGESMRSHNQLDRLYSYFRTRKAVRLDKLNHGHSASLDALMELYRRNPKVLTILKKHMKKEGVNWKKSKKWDDNTNWFGGPDYRILKKSLRQVKKGNLRKDSPDAVLRELTQTVKGARSEIRNMSKPRRGFHVKKRANRYDFIKRQIKSGNVDRMSQEKFLKRSSKETKRKLRMIGVKKALTFGAGSYRMKKAVLPFHHGDKVYQKVNGQKRFGGLAAFMQMRPDIAERVSQIKKKMTRKDFKTYWKLANDPHNTPFLQESRPEDLVDEAKIRALFPGFLTYTAEQRKKRKIEQKSKGKDTKPSELETSEGIEPDSSEETESWDTDPYFLRDWPDVNKPVKGKRSVINEHEREEAIRKNAEIEARIQLADLLKEKRDKKSLEESSEDSSEDSSSISSTEEEPQPENDLKVEDDLKVENDLKVEDALKDEKKE